MEKEISNGAMLGIVLIALAAVIGLGFGVFSIARGTANEGVTNVQENLGAVGNSAFADYDQKTVTGTQVVSAYQNFQGKPYAVLVATQAVKDNTASAGVLTSTAAGLSNAYGTTGALLNTPLVKASDSTGASMKVMKSTDTVTATCNLTYINYNALLSGAVTTGATQGDIKFDSSCWRTTNGYNTLNGKVQMNGISGNMSKSGMVEYMPSGARFQSYLIKDLSGTIMGMAFEQLNSK